MADTEISGLTADNTPGTDSLIVTVDDPAGTPATRKSTLQNVMDLFEANMTVPTSVSATYQLQPSEGAFVDGDKTKLDGIATGAIANVVEDTTPQLGGDLDGQGNRVTGTLGNTPGNVSGSLTAASHGNGIHVTNGNVTIPTTAGFSCILIAGGAHTVTFNATTSAAMAAGDVMTIVVESSTVVHAVLTAAADKVSFT